MQVDIQFQNDLISEEQAETFAYNIYRDVAEYMKTNFEEFLWWNLETISINIILTTDDTEKIERNYKYDLCMYKCNRKESDEDECSDLC